MLKSILSKAERIYRDFSKIDSAVYGQLLSSLKKKGYELILPRELPEKIDDLKKICVLVHDVDVRVEGCKVFVEAEEKLGIKSAFFLRPDAEYFSNMIGHFQDLELEGWEIGFHYDSLSRCKGKYFAAKYLFNIQLRYIRSFFNVHSTRGHGDSLNPKIYNEALYTHNQDEWLELELRDFTILPMKYSYIRDTHGKLVIPKPILNVVLMNCHSDWF